ncbi:MAG: PilZ domain-containing protein [Candidatus Acidiferrum sp.]
MQCKPAYAGAIKAALLGLRRGTKSLAGGFTIPMVNGDLPSRRTERRRAARFAFRADLDIEWGSAVLRGSTRDLSASGMFIEAADTLWVGAGFTARLKLEKPVLLDCFVKRVEPGRGMGVSVDLSKAETQQRYQELLAQLATPRP